MGYYRVWVLAELVAGPFFLVIQVLYYVLDDYVLAKYNKLRQDRIVSCLVTPASVPDNQSL